MKTYYIHIIQSPMLHDDWHNMEKHGLKFIAYIKEDNTYIFGKPENYRALKLWVKREYGE